MRHCTNCGAALAPGVRFCGACGAAVADADAVDAARVSPLGGDDAGELTRLSDDEATRLTRDAEATRVAARSPFDDRQITPARVEPLGGANGSRSSHSAQGSPYGSPHSQSIESRRTAQPLPDERAMQATPRQPNSQVSARGAAAEHDGERVVFSVRPTMLFVGLGYALAVVGAVGLTVLLARFNLLPALYSVLVSLPLLLIPAFYHLRRNTIKYTLTDAKIEIDRGLIARRTRNIPLRNIQDVTVAATIPQRLLGFGDLIIDNASELGGATVMHNIPAPRRHADLLLRELRRWN